MKQIALNRNTVDRETAKAYGIDFGKGLVWFPKSLVTVEFEEVSVSITRMVITLPEWLFYKKELHLGYAGNSLAW